MQKRDPFFWQRVTLLALAATASSFAISWVQPWMQFTGQPSALSKTQKNQDKNIPVPVSIAKTNAGLKAQKLSPIIIQLQEEVKTEILNSSIPNQFQGKVLPDVKLDAKNKVIALTFDDGPSPIYTPTVLDILKKNNIKATFFIIGQNLKAYPQLGQKIVAEGHAIANHTWSHRYSYFSPAGAAREIDDTTALIYKVTGVKTSIFRPPGGFLNNGVVDYAKKQKYFIAMWSADSSDWKRSSAEVLAKNVLRNAHPGGMALMHDGGGTRSHTIKALPKIITELKKRGYKFVTVPELLEIQDQEVKLKVAKSKAKVDITKQTSSQPSKNKNEVNKEAELSGVKKP